MGFFDICILKICGMVAADGESVRRNWWTISSIGRCSILASLRKEEGIPDSEALFSKPKESVLFVHKALALLMNVS